MSIPDVTICDLDQHTTTNTQPDFRSVLIKDRTKFEGSKMCHNWFWIDYFWLNWHLIIEILVHICWRSEFTITRPCSEITRNNTVNYFEFCHVFDKDCLHFRKVLSVARRTDFWHHTELTYEIPTNTDFFPFWYEFFIFFHQFSLFFLVISYDFSEHHSFIL